MESAEIVVHEIIREDRVVKRIVERKIQVAEIDHIKYVGFERFVYMDDEEIIEVKESYDDLLKQIRESG